MQCNQRCATLQCPANCKAWMRGTAGLNCTKRHALKLCPACIDGLSTTLEQQQLVEGLEDVNTGLVNGAHLQHSAF